MDRRATPATSFAVGIWTTLGLVTALLAARRASGAYHGPVSSSVLVLAVSLFAAAAVSAAALCTGRLRERQRSVGIAVVLILGFAWTAAAGPTGVQVGVLIATTLGALVLGAATQIDPSAWLAQQPAPLPRAEEAPRPSMAPTDRAASPQFSVAVVSEPVPEETPANDSEESVVAMDNPEADDTQTVHAMVRRREAEADVIEGTIRVLFPANQRDATVHLTFAPPFTVTPAIESEPVAGDDWEIKVEAAFPYGARLRVRRERHEVAAADRRLAYRAEAPWSQRSAA